MSVALLLIFLGLMALGVPIAISLGAASVIVLITMGNMPLTMVVQLMYTSMNSFVMVAVPLFILAGSLMDEGGIADKIYDLAEACVGWIYGGLGHVAILCNIIFGAMSGSSVAAVASIGKMSINAMAKKGYPKEYGVGINLAGCMLASVIPPSILMIVAASTASVSIGQALMAGMVPGVLIGVIYMVYNYIHCKVTGIGEKSPFQPKRLVKAFLSAIPALMVPVIMLVGMYSGIYTPTEGAGIAVAYAMLVSIYVYKRLKWSDIPRIIAKNARQTGTILFIATAAIYILVPILLPVVKQLGVSPLFFVVFLVITLSFGLITPPVGVCLYAAENVTGLSLEKVIKSVVPWLFLTVGIICIFIFFPQIITGPIALMFPNG